MKSSKGKTDWARLRREQKAAPKPTQKERDQARQFWAHADIVIPNGKPV